MTETEIMHEVRAAIMSTGQFLLWRNNVGFDATRKIKYGLGVGSADLISIHKPTGRFVGWEIKTPKGRMDPEQILWQNAIRAANGLAWTVRSPEEAQAFIRSLPVPS